MWIYIILGWLALCLLFTWGWARFWNRVEPVNDE